MGQSAGKAKAWGKIHLISCFQERVQGGKTQRSLTKYSQDFLHLQGATVKLLWCVLNPLAPWRWAPGEQEECRGQHRVA